MTDDVSEDRLRALTDELVSRLRRSVNEAELAELEDELNSIIAVARVLGVPHA